MVIEGAQLSDHVTSDFHQLKLIEFFKTPIPPPSFTRCEHCCMIVRTDSWANHIASNEHKTWMANQRYLKSYCHLCNSTFPNGSWASHSGSKKHKRQIGKFHNRPAPMFPMRRCNVCYSDVPNEVWEIHEKGKIHRDWMAARKQSTSVAPTSRKRRFGEEEGGGGEVMDGRELKKIMCNRCKTHCSIQNWAAHLASATHKQNMTAWLRLPSPHPAFRRCYVCCTMNLLPSWRTTHSKSKRHVVHAKHTPALPDSEIYCRTCRRDVPRMGWDLHMRSLNHLKQSVVSPVYGYCHMCKVEVTVPNWNNHLRDKHPNVIHKRKSNFGTFMCEICNRVLHGLETYTSHVESVQHIKCKERYTRNNNGSVLNVNSSDVNLQAVAAANVDRKSNIVPESKKQRGDGGNAIGSNTNNLNFATLTEKGNHSLVPENKSQVTGNDDDDVEMAVFDLTKEHEQNVAVSNMSSTRTIQAVKASRRSRFGPRNDVSAARLSTAPLPAKKNVVEVIDIDIDMEVTATATANNKDSTISKNTKEEKCEQSKDIVAETTMKCEVCKIECLASKWNDHVRSKSHEETVRPRVYCVSCKTEFSVAEWSDHERRHGASAPEHWVQCVVCNETCYSMQAWVTHMIGEKHMTEMRKFALIPEIEKEQESKNCTGKAGLVDDEGKERANVITLPAAAADKTVDDVEVITVQTTRKKGQDQYCKLCNEHIRNSSWIDHVASRKHMMSSCNEAPFVTPPEMVHCNLCNFSCNQSDWNKHIASVQHRAHTVTAPLQVYCNDCENYCHFVDWNRHSKRHGRRSARITISCDVCNGTRFMSIETCNRHFVSHSHQVKLNEYVKEGVKTVFCDYCNSQFLPEHFELHRRYEYCRKSVYNKSNMVL